MTILEYVKLNLRLSSETFDPLLEELIFACQDEIHGQGVDYHWLGLQPSDETTVVLDRRVTILIVLYCRVHYNNADNTKDIKYPQVWYSNLHGLISTQKIIIPGGSDVV